jgi:alpha-1,6-mannosyltransferase
VAREKPDVLEASSPYVAAWVATRTRGVAVRSLVLHSDFIDTYARPVLRRALGDRGAERALSPAWAYLRGLCSRVDLTVVSGAWLADKLRSRGIPRVECVPFGIHREALGPHRRDPALRRQLLGPLADDPGARLHAAAGRRAGEGRGSAVLQALEGLRRERPCAVLVLGDGPERARLEARFPWARFEGFVTDRARYGALLASGDALVHGCPHETFGFVVGEALASGVPVVVPDQGGAAEFATPGCAEKYAPDAPLVACAVATRRLLDRPPGEASRAALEASAGIPSSDDHFDKLFAVYGRYLEARRAA